MKHAIYKQSWLGIVFLLCQLMIVACSHHDNIEPFYPINPTEDNDTVQRTILVYMVATNNLGGNSDYNSGFDGADIKEMIQASESGDFGDGRLLAYHATTRGIMLKEIKDGAVDTLKIYDDSDLSVSIDRMRQVINDVKEIAPAKEYGLILWSHATGWLQDGIAETITQQRSYGKDGTKKMNITSLAAALEGSGFTFIYNDCCYMGSVEVMYEMRKCAPYIIASPTEVPGEGMPYHKTLKYLFDTTLNLDSAMVKAAETTFNNYNDVFKIGDCPCTMTVVRTAAIERVAQLTQQIYMLAPSSVNVSYNYQRYSKDYNCYYYDFDQYVESLSTDEALLQEWRNAFSEAVIYASATPYIWKKEYPIERCSGLSTYILTSRNEANTQSYNTLSWYDAVASSLFD